MNSTQRKAYLIGGGIGSLAAAAFMIRDGGMAGERITIFESASTMGGSLDGNGNPIDGYVVRGGRMFTSDNYECMWALLKTIPSLNSPNCSVYEETMAFNLKLKTDAHARLVDSRRARVPVESMGFSMHDRAELLKLALASEEALDSTRITDWLSPGFFATAFWAMWATTFAFQPWHCATEFKRYLHRFMLEFTRIETLGGVKRTIYNQFDSLVRPLQAWLAGHGVLLLNETTITRLDREYRNEQLVVTRLHGQTRAESTVIDVDEHDLVIIQNGSMTDASSLGSMSAAPPALGKRDSHSWNLWEQLSDGKPGYGNPAAFNGCIAQSCWQSFTVTLTHSCFFEQMERFSENSAGTGGLVTFKDSNWLMSIVLAHQPHFIDQPDFVHVFWGYGLFPDRVGNFVNKSMAECTGAEIIRELLGHLRFDQEPAGTYNCIPCRMPYITSMFMPRQRSDRPLPVPRDSKNLAFVSQFVEIADDVVFTVEYSVRAAQIAVYQLLSIDQPIPAITAHDHSLHTQFDAVIKAMT